jgi:hypothetical protein
MLKIYLLIVVLGILGGVGYGAKYYYDTTQNTIATLRENNVQLEIAAETAQASVNALQADMKKLGEINNQLQLSLQKAEAYGDELRSKLSKLNLVVEALKDSKVLEGKMNGASAKLWRGIMDDTGGNSDIPTPIWLQQSPSGSGDQNSSQSGEGSDTNSSSTKTSPAQ